MISHGPLDEIRAGTSKPFGVNIPPGRVLRLLEIALRKKIPVMVASQGGPREHLPRFRAVGTKWLHVVASVEHAKKAEAAGVDALVVDGAEAGGHPPPSNVGTIVLVRRIVRATPAGRRERRRRRRRRHRRALALGAEAVQLGTRFIATPEASVHENYKRAVLAADVHDTCLVGPAALPIRQIRNAFTRKFDAASHEEREALFKASSLKKAALEATSSGARSKPGRAPASSTRSCPRPR